MGVNDYDIETFLACPTRAHLKSIAANPSNPQFSEHRAREAAFFRCKQRTELEGKMMADTFPVGTTLRDAFQQTRARLLFDCKITAGGIDTTLHAVERLPGRHDGPAEQFIPYRHIPGTRIRKEHRILIAFDAVALEKQTGQIPQFGRLVHGPQAGLSKVKLTPQLLNEARYAVDSVMAMQGEEEPPEFMLHKGCSDCEFQTRCRTTAREADDLSVISSMPKTDRQKLHQKGIFTVTQLSYTFRLRRNRKDPDAVYRKRHDALRALAIREQKTHVLGKPDLNLGAFPVYVDVEGKPDLSYYYLIGICYPHYDRLVYRAFWADSHSGEKSIWDAFLKVLKGVKEPTIVHYGSYETTCLKRLSKRYCEAREDSEFVDRLVGQSKNVLSTIFHHIYFPVYTNSLKDIARHLGFRWMDPEMTGGVAAIRRFEWELTGDPKSKQQLLTYNEDDCRALAHVAQTVVSLCQSTPDDDVVAVTDSPYIGGFGQKLVTPDLAAINEASYWEHQRNLVYVKSSARLRVLSRRHAAKKKRAIRATRSVEPLPPYSCSECGATRFYTRQQSSRTLFDIKFTARGISRDVAKYVGRSFRCCHCNAVVARRPDRWPERKYGQGFLSYVVYQLVEQCLFQRAIARSVNDLLGFTTDGTTILQCRRYAAQQYHSTYDEIRHRIVAGRLVHADETHFRLKGGQDGYVWVVTNMEDVYFFFTRTRESDMVKDMLEGFDGVLVSDFYVGYDSIPCRQQKCLIHLMRDLNDDLLRQPFDEELKELVARFAGLLRPIIEAIDNCGLKKSRLSKHLRRVSEFYEWLDEADFTSNISVQYRQRFEKNRDRLFTFLEHDDVPWNNNNAEHAIKAFAKLRNVIESLIGEVAIAEYLILLSVCVTCKYKGVGVLEFLRSGIEDIDEFIRRRRK